MTALRIDKLEDYARFLQSNPGEAEALFQEILISSTGFFREPETLHALESVVYPGLLKNRAERDPIRIWVPACSTGEEAYSIAISIEEFLNRRRAHLPVQIFATDVNEKLVVKARQGVYQDIGGVSSERLKRFFTKSNGSYQVSKTIRSNVIFSRHNVLSEPPFSRIDLHMPEPVDLPWRRASRKGPKNFPLFVEAARPSRPGECRARPRPYSLVSSRE
jgi:two-component system, chemotaxis family, CheB/CheR fusion protein